jgi:oxygen-independent coproporphyrinogen-3 oxidase
MLQATVAGMAFGVYVHVPWCASRCGYCDFNTYVPGRLRGASPEGFADSAVAEWALHRVDRLADTVFFGGGTPTLLPAAALAEVLAAIPLAPGAEVTVEANPESVDLEKLRSLRAAGFTRVSIGMQSGSAHVLAVLERAHSPGRAVQAARWAREAGFEHVSLDLIYGTQGESDEDWERTVEEALSAAPDHVSAYGLLLEPGTRMTARVRSGRLPALDEEAMARRYAFADRAFESAGLSNYELCNWGAPCLHNVGYWRSDDWIGIGPGAHSHAGGTRWWNVLHPARWAERVQDGTLPVAGREVLSDDARRVERVMLGLRMAEGLPAEELAGAEPLVQRGLLRRAGDRYVLTFEGRLLSDRVVAELI